MGRPMDYYPVTRHVARCGVDRCPWRQEHITLEDVTADGERHLE